MHVAYNSPSNSIIFGDGVIDKKKSIIMAVVHSKIAIVVHLII